LSLLKIDEYISGANFTSLPFPFFPFPLLLLLLLLLLYLLLLLLYLYAIESTNLMKGERNTPSGSVNGS